MTLSMVFTSDVSTSTKLMRAQMQAIAGLEIKKNVKSPFGD